MYACLLIHHVSAGALSQLPPRSPQEDLFVLVDTPSLPPLPIPSHPRLISIMGWRTCLCWLMSGISISWLGEAISCRRCGVEAEAFCLFRHMQTRKKRQAMTRGMAMLGTRMYRIPILLPSRGPGYHRGDS